MNTKDFIRLGVPLGEATRRATDFVSKFILGGGDKSRLEEEVKAIIANPSAFTTDSLRQEFAKALLNAPPPPRTNPVKYRQWGQGLEHEAVMQMEKACLLPIAVAGALMPDAHVGYGLPIGGVLATENAVIPYAVGVDIACRMKMTVLDMPVKELDRHQDRLTRAIEAETRFGVGATFKNRRHHEVIDAHLSVSPATQKKQKKTPAWGQVWNPGAGKFFCWGSVFLQHTAKSTIWKQVLTWLCSAIAAAAAPARLFAITTARSLSANFPLFPTNSNAWPGCLSILRRVRNIGLQWN